jgi:hypothetical protein
MKNNENTTDQKFIDFPPGFYFPSYFRAHLPIIKILRKRPALRNR